MGWPFSKSEFSNFPTATAAAPGATNLLTLGRKSRPDFVVILGLVWSGQLVFFRRCVTAWFIFSDRDGSSFPPCCGLDTWFWSERTAWTFSASRMIMRQSPPGLPGKWTLFIIYLRKWVFPRTLTGVWVWCGMLFDFISLIEDIFRSWFIIKKPKLNWCFSFWSINKIIQVIFSSDTWSLRSNGHSLRLDQTTHVTQLGRKIRWIQLTEEKVWKNCLSGTDFLQIWFTATFKDGNHPRHTKLHSSHTFKNKWLIWLAIDHAIAHRLISIGQIFFCCLTMNVDEWMAVVGAICWMIL